MSTSGFHIGSPKTMLEWLRWIYSHIETLDKVRIAMCLTQYFMLNTPFIK